MTKQQLLDTVTDHLMRLAGQQCFVIDRDDAEECLDRDDAEGHCSCNGQSYFLACALPCDLRDDAMKDWPVDDWSWKFPRAWEYLGGEPTVNFLADLENEFGSASAPLDADDVDTSLDIIAREHGLTYDFGY